MPRLKQLTIDATTGSAKALLEGVQRKRGHVPPLFSALANSPSALAAYVAFGGAMASTSLSPALKEQLSIAVSAANGCNHCVQAHTRFGRAAGVPEAELIAAQTYASADPLALAALEFAHRLQETRGQMPDDAMVAARAAGLSDAQMVDIAAVVAINYFTNYVNNLAKPTAGEPDEI